MLGGETEEKAKKRLRLALGVFGKHQFRIRERHLADHLAPLIAGHAYGAAKLDLILRCIALSPQHAGKRSPGFVLGGCTWENLHDMARGADQLGVVEPGMDPPASVLKLKRKWVGNQLDRLESMELVRRTKRPGRRSQLFVLKDDGSGEPFDDPTGDPERYMTVLGVLIANRTLAGWGAAELAAYLAASVAERHESRPGPLGRGKWFRQLAWFADRENIYGPESRVRIPFSVPTLERGIKRLVEEGLIDHQRITRNPRTGKRLQGPRNLYTNRFGEIDSRKLTVEVEDLAEGETIL